MRSSAMQFHTRYQTGEPWSDFVQCQNIVGGVQFGGRLRHAINRTARFVLCDSVMAAFTQPQQSFSAISAHSGQHDTNYITRPKAVGALKKNIHRRPVRTLRRLTSVSKSGRAGKYKMIVAASQQHRSWFGTIAFPR